MTWMQPKDHFHDFDASFMLHFLYCGVDGTKRKLQMLSGINASV